MSKNQRTFFIVMGAFQLLIVTTMIGWILWDAYKAISIVSQQPITQFLLEPIVWHKVGEILIAIPVGIAFAAFYILWKPAYREKYLRIISPLMVCGGVFNLIASWGYYQKPRTDFANFMVYFGFVLFIASLLIPPLLKWVHIKRTHVESKATSQAN